MSTKPFIHTHRGTRLTLIANLDEFLCDCQRSYTAQQGSRFIHTNLTVGQLLGRSVWPEEVVLTHVRDTQDIQLHLIGNLSRALYLSTITDSCASRTAGNPTHEVLVLDK